MTTPADQAVFQVLANLADMDRPALAVRWEEVFGCPAPRHSKSQILRLALAWQAQMKASPVWRGRSGATRLARCLRQTAAPIVLTPGTRLVREWQGRTHQVTVLAKGFDYDGVTYSSLSAIARKITGTAWSGPAFFGVKS